MARSLKLKRYEIKNIAHLHLHGFRQRIEVSEVIGDMDPNIFVYAQSAPDSQGNVFDIFQTVASFPDLAEYPVGSPNLATSPFYRLNYVELDVRSTEECQVIWQRLSAEACNLVAALNRADSLELVEEAWCGSDGTITESESVSVPYP